MKSTYFSFSLKFSWSLQMLLWQHYNLSKVTIASSKFSLSPIISIILFHSFHNLKFKLLKRVYHPTKLGFGGYSDVIFSGIWIIITLLLSPSSLLFAFMRQDLAIYIMALPWTYVAQASLAPLASNTWVLRVLACSTIPR